MEKSMKLSMRKCDNVSITIAAAEVAVGLAILVVVYRRRKTVYVDELNEMRG